MAEPRTPSPELAGKFEVVGVEPGVVETVTHGRIDLRTIDLATATKLVATGRFPYLVAVPQPNPALGSAPADATNEAPSLATPRPPRRRAKA